MISIHTIEVGDIVYLDVAKENRDCGFNPGPDGTKCEVVSFDSESTMSKGEPNKFWPTIRYLEGERKGETEPMLTLHLSTDNPKERPVFQPTVKNIVIEYLQKNGFDGLTNVDLECGCHLEDFAPCGQVCEDCEAGYQVPCDCGSCDFHISRQAVPKKLEGKEDDERTE